MAPDFELPSEGGQIFTLSKHQGAVRVLFFVRNSGHFIQDALNATELVVSSQPIFQQKTLLVCIVTEDLEGSQFEAFRGRFHLKWVFLHDHNEAIHRLYKVIAVPTTVIINERGEICGRLAGYSLASGKEFRTILSACLRIPDIATTHLTTATLEADRFVALGDVLLARAMPEAALRNYQKALEILPTLAVARWRVGLGLLRQGRVTSGTQELQRVWAADPASTPALVGLAWAQALEGKAKEASAELEKLRPPASKMPEYFEAWAAVHEAMGARDEARQDQEQADQLRGRGVVAPVSRPKKGKVGAK